MTGLPAAVNAAIDVWLSTHASGSLKSRAGDITTTYKSGGSSARVDIAAYLATRAPATYASVSKALQAVASVIVDPKSLLDIGAGAGSATWAALNQWPGITSATLLDNDPRFLQLAGDIASHSENAAMIRAKYMLGDIGASALPQADCVVASYVLAERPASEAARLARNMWAASSQLLLVVEPGTPAGFERIKSVRNALIAEGAHIAAPCTHASKCPMTGADWCHFKARLQRSRTHMHAKSATVPWEDEPFSHIAAVRHPIDYAGSRIVRPSNINKTGAEFTACSQSGLQKILVPSRDREHFSSIKKLDWGDVIR